jgi:hypothetical protein
MEFSLPTSRSVSGGNFLLLNGVEDSNELELAYDPLLPL